MKPAIAILTLLALAAPAVSYAAEASTAPGKPNFVLILADNMGYADIGVHGCKDIPTPHIDRIAAKGVRFTDAYANGSFCTPTRAALMNGCYQHRFGVEDLASVSGPLPKAVRTLPDRLPCFANKSRRSIGKRGEPLPIPETLDYELWCGPARKEPIYRDRIQYDCSFTWNMGDGESCNQGVHEVDVARWILGYTGLPRRTMSIGGRFVVNDAGEVPNTQIICYDYPEAPILYEVHNLPKNMECMTPQRWKTQPDFKGARVGVCVQCEGGYTLGNRCKDVKWESVHDCVSFSADDCPWSCLRPSR